MSLNLFSENQPFQLPRRWVQVIVILAVLTITAGISLSPSEKRLLLALGGLAGIGALIALLYKPPIGLAVLVAACLTFPFSIGTGTGSSLNSAILILALLVGLWALNKLVSKTKYSGIISRPLVPLFAFALIAILSFGFGQLPWFTFSSGAPIRAQLGGLALFLLSFTAFFLVTQQIRNVAWLEVYTWIYIALGFLYVISRVIPALTTTTYRIFLSYMPGSLFWLWLVALSLSQSLYNKKLPGWFRIILLAVPVITFSLSITQMLDWMSGWLPLLVAALVVLFVGAPLAGLAITIPGLVVVLVKLTSILDVLYIGGNEYSLNTRLVAWNIIYQIAKVNPILGLGPANYYWYTPLFPIMGYSVSFNSHNNYVDIIAQTGIVGLLCFVWFVIELSRVAWKIKPHVPDGFPKAYLIGCLGGLAGTLVAGMMGDWIIPFVYNLGFNGFRTSVLGWLFLGGIVALQYIFVFSKKTIAESSSTSDANY